jgi:hypothetical protein
VLNAPLKGSLVRGEIQIEAVVVAAGESVLDNAPACAGDVDAGAEWGSSGGRRWWCPSRTWTPEAVMPSPR